MVTETRGGNGKLENKHLTGRRRENARVGESLGGTERSLTKRLQEAAFSVEGWLSILTVFLPTDSLIRNVNSETNSKRPHATEESEL